MPQLALLDRFTGETVEITVMPLNWRLSIARQPMLGTPTVVFDRLYPTREALERAYQQRVSALLTAGDYVDFDNVEVIEPPPLHALIGDAVGPDIFREAALRRHPIFDEVKTLIATVPLRGRKLRGLAKEHNLVLDHQRFVDAFSYVIEIERGQAVDAGKLELGVSKLGGLPSLPQRIEWPEGYAFYAQLAMGDVSGLDHNRRFPGAGMFWVFTRPDGAGKLLFSDATDLAPRFAPTGHDAALRLFEASETPLSFRPNFYFDLRPGRPQVALAAFDALPAQTLKRINACLGNSKLRPMKDLGGDRIFGRPVDPHALFDVFFQLRQIHGAPIARQQSYYMGHDLLLLQLRHEDGHILVGVPFNDLQRARVDRAIVRYVGGRNTALQRR